MSLSSIDAAIKSMKNGRGVIVVDDEDRENEGDLIFAAETISTRQIAFMIRYTSGIICAPCEETRLKELEIPQMVEQNQDPNRTAFTVSVDHITGLTTGVSAQERAATIRALANPEIGAQGFVRPGHVFPLRYRSGGVLVRSGHTEAAIDLCRLADLQPVGALAELTLDNGSMMRLPDLLQFAEQHDMPIISIESLIRYRSSHETLVILAVQQKIHLLSKDWDCRVYRTEFDGNLVTVLISGNIKEQETTLVRIVRADGQRDLLSSALMEGNVIHKTLQMIADAPQGVFIYLPYRGESSAWKQQTGDTWREVGVGSHILSSLGVKRIHLLSSKEFSFPGISSFGLHIETIIKAF